MLFKDEYGFLSNFYPCKVTTPLGTFQCSEAAYMAEKCASPLLVEKFFNLKGAQAKKLGSQVPLRDGWNDMRIEKMEMVLRAKFSDPELFSRLKAVTGIIQEDNMWNDTFWGVCKGVGQNNLGKLLMKLRDEREDVGMSTKEQVQAAIALLVATGGFDYVVGLLENDIFESDEFEEWQVRHNGYDMEEDENGQLSLPATAEMKLPEQKKFRGECVKCVTGLNSKVTLNGNVFFVPTALINARGLERAVIELRRTAQEGMKPRWDMLLAGFF